MTVRICRLCPRLPVLGIATLYPRHVPPPAQLQLMRELDAPAGPRRRPPSLVGVVIGWLRDVVFAGQVTLRLGVLKIRFGSALTRLSRAPARVVLRTWCFGPPSPQTPDDFYYGLLPQQLDERGVSSVLLCGDTRERFDTAFARAALHHPTIRRVPEQLLVPIWAPLAVAWRQLATALALRRLALQADTDRFATVCAAACAGSVQPITLCNTLLFYVAREAVKRWRAGVFVTFYEGQPWEQAAWLGARTASPACVLVGYQHTVLKPFSVSVVSPRRTPWQPATPDVVLCLGEVTRRMMLKGHEPFGSRLVSFGRCRRMADDPGLLPPRPERRTVLVIPEGILTECQSLFDFAAQAAARLPDHRFIFRCHPVLPFKALRAHLRDAPERLPNIEVSERRSLAEDCARSSVALYRGSSTVLYAMRQGLKPVYVHDDRFPDADPLFALTEWRETVKAPEEFPDCLRRYAATPEVDTAAQWRLGVRFVDDYTQPVNEASLDRFLDAAGMRNGGGRLR